MKFRKRPVVIEAERFLDGSHSLSPEFAKAICVLRDVPGGGPRIDGPHLVPHIHTLEGPQFPSPGDWIIKGVKGEFYPVKPDIFDLTYDPAGETGE